MEILYFVLALLGVICFVVAALNAVVERVNLIALGLALVFTVEVIKLARAL